VNERLDQISPLENLLADARRRLLETGTRNRLIHVNRANKRSNVLNIINERSDDIFEILHVKNRKMRFLAKGKDNEDVDQDILFKEIDEEFDVSRYTDNILETPIGPDALQKRLLRLSRDSRTAEEEQGVNILYLALGFLTWYEDDKSKIKREAPLILLPVSLERNTRTASYDIVSREDDIATNMPLQERFKLDFGIDFPEIDEAEDGFSPSKYIDQIRPIIAERKNWEIDENGIQLGFFSFAKFIMLRDLDHENWPNKTLLTNPLISGLLQAKYEAPDFLFSAEDKLDKLFEPKDIIQVVDADASQTKVIEEVRFGGDLLVQGPPGTGKSQTITNIIASAIHDGKKVLFVAEKMAALSVVYKRLVDVGLQNGCLEVHSRSANKKKFLHELSRTLNEVNAVANMPSAPEKLTVARNTLNQHSELMHSIVPGTAFTPFEIISKVVGHIGNDDPPPSFKEDRLALLTRDEIKELDTLISTIAKLLVNYSRPSQHPFSGTQNLDLQPTDIKRLTIELKQAYEISNDYQVMLSGLSQSLSIDDVKSQDEAKKLSCAFESVNKIPLDGAGFVPNLLSNISSSRLGEGLESGFLWQSYRDQLKGTFTAQGLEYSASHLRAGIFKGVSSFFGRISSHYRTSSRELAGLLKNPIPKKAKARFDLIEQLIELELRYKKLSNDENYLKKILGSEWRGDITPFAVLHQTYSCLREVNKLGFLPSSTAIQSLIVNENKLTDLKYKLDSQSKTYADACSKVSKRLKLNINEIFNCHSLSSADVSLVIQSLNTLKSNISTYDDWVTLLRATQKLNAKGLERLVQGLEVNVKKGDEITREFHYALSEALWKKARQECPDLVKLINTSRHALVKSFQNLEKERIEDVQKIIYKKHLEQLPLGSVGQMAVLRGEIAKKSRHKSIRKLMTLSGPVIQKIKPVFLMSPISVAQFLPPEKLEFDLLVIDEASQVRPEDALGVIARCKQIVVVGDQQQLPPTNFFSRITENNEDDDEETQDPLEGAVKATEMESILTLCEARGVNQKRLEWHYRSRDPSLIKVSNAEFYENSLVLPPSPLQEDKNYGFKFTKVNGIYARGKLSGGRMQTNKIEAQAVVDALKKHARNWPDLSIGVVTFSSKQRNMLTELLEFERRSDKVLDSFLREGRNEDVFVKNIENVQGDERDVILISVGYGPSEAGGRLASMNFGPINRDGGERRLNVLFSRSRIRCEVFASFEPGDINLNRTKKEGPRVLKRFLEYAKSGELEEYIPTGKNYDSPFEADVARVVQSLGYQSDTQVGSAGFVIDLCVKHPKHSGQYMIAIECDGASYHSALWARERDRLRQGVLEGLGWQFYRIWSTDWFQRREKEIERLAIVLKDAAMGSSAGSTLTGANKGYQIRNTREIEENNKKIVIQPLKIPELIVPKYVIFKEKTVPTSKEPHEVAFSIITEILSRIIDTEGPIHYEEIGRRYATTLGKSRAGARIMARVQQVLKRLGKAGEYVENDDFWSTISQYDSPPVRNRSLMSGGIIKGHYIPPAEIKAAADLIIKQSGEVEKEDLIKAIGKLLGFKRVGPDLNSAFSDALR